MHLHEVFYAPPEQIVGDTILLRGEELHHLRSSLRKQSGDRVAIVDGRGTCYRVELERVDREGGEGHILGRTTMWGEPHLKLTVATAVPKGSRIEYAIEKGTELGVCRFVPLRTGRSVAASSPAKIARWQRLALAAMKQSRRSVLPEIEAESLLRDVLDRFRPLRYRFVAVPSGRGLDGLRRRHEVGQEAGEAVVLIGPEGGFSDDELSAAADAGFAPLSLGPRRLRTETAAIAAATLILYAAGELESGLEMEP